MVPISGGGGAGLGIHAATARVEACSFSGNVTEALPFDSVEGGGALQARKSSLTLLHSAFRENSCIEGKGGAVALISCDSNPVIAGCTMSENSVVTESGSFTHGGGGAV